MNRTVLGVKITDVRMQQAVEMLCDSLQAPGRSHSVFYVNAHTLNLACEDHAYRALLNRASCVFGDGTGVRMAMRMQNGVPPQDNVNGTDLIPKLFAHGKDKGLRHYLLGNTPMRIARAALFAQREFPSWSLAGYHHGYVTEFHDDALVQRINAASPHLLLVGMGNPIQEQWIDRNLSRLRVPVCMGVGGLFDYWSGDLERAPAWLRERGCEWLHLLVKQPSKFSRYVFGNPKFLARACVQSVAQKSVQFLAG